MTHPSPYFALGKYTLGVKVLFWYAFCYFCTWITRQVEERTRSGRLKTLQNVSDGTALSQTLDLNKIDSTQAKWNTVEQNIHVRL